MPRQDAPRSRDSRRRSDRDDHQNPRKARGHPQNVRPGGCTFSSVGRGRGVGCAVPGHSNPGPNADLRRGRLPISFTKPEPEPDNLAIHTPRAELVPGSGCVHPVTT